VEWNGFGKGGLVGGGLWWRWGCERGVGWCFSALFSFFLGNSWCSHLRISRSVGLVHSAIVFLLYWPSSPLVLRGRSRGNIHSLLLPILINPSFSMSIISPAFHSSNHQFPTQTSQPNSATPTPPPPPPAPS